jgi:hypothetical protein
MRARTESLTCHRNDGCRTHAKSADLLLVHVLGRSCRNSLTDTALMVQSGGFSIFPAFWWAGDDAMAGLPGLDELFEGRHFDCAIIILCVRWYLRFKLSFQDLVEMMAERGLSMAHHHHALGASLRS